MYTLNLYAVTWHYLSFYACEEIGNGRLILRWVGVAAALVWPLRSSSYLQFPRDSPNNEI
jgi:hypothetical protein